MATQAEVEQKIPDSMMEVLNLVEAYGLLVNPNQPRGGAGSAG